MPTYMFGRRPGYPEDTHPRLKIGPYLTAAAPPASVDWYSRVSDWPMYLNDQIGDCTEAMVGHLIENASTYGAGSTVEIADSDVLTAYERVSGYNPSDPGTDQGAVLQDVYNDWRKTGVGGHKNLVFAQVDHTNDNQLKTAVDQFGAVGLGILVTQDMMDAFNDGRPWSGHSGQQLGGHAVPIVGYDSQYVYVVTWAKVQKMTWACYAAVTDESWVAVLPEWFSAAGQDPQGVDLYGLGEAFAELTGQANPFPQPSPTGHPRPHPDPDAHSHPDAHPGERRGPDAGDRRARLAQAPARGRQRRLRRRTAGLARRKGSLSPPLDRPPLASQGRPWPFPGSPARMSAVLTGTP